MTQTATPARLVESLFRFSAALTAFGYQQVCNAIVRPAAILNTVGPLREAMDSAANALSKSPTSRDREGAVSIEELPSVPEPQQTQKPAKVRARKK